MISLKLLLYNHIAVLLHWKVTATIFKLCSRRQVNKNSDFILVEVARFSSEVSTFFSYLRLSEDF